MSTTREIAIDILPHFSSNVLKGNVQTYGYYANKIGRKPEKESMIIGPAMHLIGAACIFGSIPVAPLYFIKNSCGKRENVFTNSIIEKEYVYEHKTTLYVVARDNRYIENDFERIDRGLKQIMPEQWSPHDCWGVAITRKPKGSNKTYFELALEKYKQIFEELRLKKTA